MSTLADFQNDTTLTTTGMNNNNSGMDEHFIDGVKNLVMCCILIISILLTYLISSRNITRYFPPSGAAMIFGIILGGILEVAKLINIQQEFTFSPEVFYFFLLPPIIFEAGYNMKKRNFFLNMGGILLYAVVGTVISAFVFGYFLYFFSWIGVLENIDNNNVIEAMLFGSLISAIDPVATLSIMGSPGMNVHTTVYSLVFGESVLNDAVAIVLFRTFDSYVGASKFGILQIFEMLGQFALVSFGSFGIGVGIGLLSAIFFKHISNLRNHPYIEVSLTMLFAYVSFLVAEISGMSGVMSLFLTGVIMKHYNWYSISTDAQTTTYHLFKTIAFVAETFVFVYVGMNITGFYSFKLKWDPVLIIFSLIACFVSRFFNIFPLSAIANIGRKSKITFKMQLMIWFAGLRGAVAFALALNVRTGHRSEVITTTLFLVLFTTLILGLATTPLLKKLGLQNNIPDLNDEDGLHEGLLLTTMDGGEDPSKHEEFRSKKNISWAHRMWRMTDERFMKPLFGGQPRHNETASSSE